MNRIDREFKQLADEIRKQSEKELYYTIRKYFDQVPYATQKSCMDFIGNVAGENIREEHRN